MWRYLGFFCTLFFFSLFFVLNLDGSSLERTVVYEIRREIVLSKCDGSNVSIKYSVTRYDIFFPSSMCLHSALSHSYLEEEMFSAPEERVWTKTLNPVLSIQPCMLQINLPVVLLVGVKIGKGAKFVWSKGLSQTLTIWKLARDCSPQCRDSSAKLSTEELLSLLWKHLALFTLGVGIEVCVDLWSHLLCQLLCGSHTGKTMTLCFQRMSYTFWLWGLRSTLSDLYKIGLRGVKITRAGNSTNKQQFLQGTSQKPVAGEWGVQDFLAPLSHVFLPCVSTSMGSSSKSDPD